MSYSFMHKVVICYSGKNILFEKKVIDEICFVSYVIIQLGAHNVIHNTNTKISILSQFWKSELNTQNEKVLRGEVRAIENTERIYVSIQNIVRLSHFLSVRYFTINSSLSRIYAKCQVSPSWDLNKNSLGWWKKIIYPSFIWSISNIILYLIISKQILSYGKYLKIITWKIEYL